MIKKQPSTTNPMLEYTKQILEKVSFDSQLFQKEFKKATKYLRAHEVEELILWCRATFGSDILPAF